MRILLVGGNDGLREFLRDSLDAGDRKVMGARSATAALAGLEEGPAPDIVILDHYSAGPDSSRLAQRIQGSPRLRASRLILIIGDAAEASSDILSDAVLQKPFDLGELEAVIDLLHP